jgi:hypothetical protein
MPQQIGSVVLRPLVMALAVIVWMGIYALISRLVSRPASRFRLATWGIAGFGFSFAIGWLIQYLVFGPVGYATAERAAVERFTLTSIMRAGAIFVCAGITLAAWARVEGRPLLAALFRPPANVGDRALGCGVGALAYGLPVALGYV